VRGALIAFARRVCSLRISAESRRLQETASGEAIKLWEKLSSGKSDLKIEKELQAALLEFIADFANWDNSTEGAYLETARKITEAAHQFVGGGLGPSPLVIDPFAGGGAIPLECVRIGADAFASDLNPLPILLNKMALEFIPRYRQQLPEQLGRWGKVVCERLRSKLGDFYKVGDSDEAVAFIWGRTIVSDAPDEGNIPVEVPLLRSLWLSKKGTDKRALRWARSKDGSIACRIITKQFDNGKTLKVRQPLLEVFQPKREKDVEAGTVARGSVTCPITNYTTNVKRVREQLGSRNGGGNDARLCCVVSTRTGQKGRFYRVPTEQDETRISEATQELNEKFIGRNNKGNFVPTETLPLMSGVFNAPIYGHKTWRSLFAPRQLLAMASLSKIIKEIKQEIARDFDDGLATAVQTLLAFALDKQADLGNALCAWEPIAQCPRHLFGRQAIGMVWDFAEGNPTGSSSGSFEVLVDGLVRSLERLICDWREGHVAQADARHHPLPDNSASCLFTDPPYYNAVPYADLSDFFYVWLKRTIGESYPELFTTELSPKAQEICEMSGWDPVRYQEKDGAWYEDNMREALSEARRVIAPNGIGVIVFAHKSTAGWEAQLQAMIDAGWTITCSWPIDTENTSRLRAQGAAALGSSIHLVCKPRENCDGSVSELVGEWRDVLSELPRKIHEWMPRLRDENVVGADAIFSCLGPALEVYSRYSRVEKASGECATLREYLEHVWAAISTEALSMIFKDADAAGMEPDARLTAMWLWTLGNAQGKDDLDNRTVTAIDDASNETDEDDEDDNKKKNGKGYFLEYDAARKIAQGLGIHLEHTDSIVEVSGDSARLLPVGERVKYLFDNNAQVDAPKGRKKQKLKQRSLFEELDEIESEIEQSHGGELKPQAGETVLDRVHQSMILFASGRGEAMRRFLVDDGAGNDSRFWTLAQSLSALYPTGSDEKRWVDGVLARKKGLGL
jgi:adenine-specific DNA methylase